MNEREFSNDMNKLMSKIWTRVQSSKTNVEPHPSLMEASQRVFSENAVFRKSAVRQIIQGRAIVAVLLLVLGGHALYFRGQDPMQMALGLEFVGTLLLTLFVVIFQTSQLEKSFGRVKYRIDREYNCKIRIFLE